MALIISADEIKKQFPTYTPEKAEFFHRQSAKLADKAFDVAIKKNPFREVILLSGGAASGKTEFLVTQLNRKRCVIFDATLDTIERAQIKIKSILRRQKKPVIYAVIPDDLKRAFIAFLNRDRKFSDEHFYRTHTSDEKLQFLKMEFDSRRKFIEYLINKRLTENDIINLINES